MSTFYFIRHGQQDHDVIKDMHFTGYGLELVPLTPLGETQAGDCAGDFRLHDCEIILTSPYTRALQTAAILSRRLGKDLRVEVDLREHELDMAGRVESLEELRSIAPQHQREVHGGNEDGDHTRETYESLKARVTAVLEKYRGY
ncbi:MAG: histidine phosphatase family protein, partial [Clostridia bacterium]